MTKEEILKLNLSAEQKERITAAFETASKFNKPCAFEACKTKKEVESKANELIKNYQKRKEAEDKRKQKALADQEVVQRVVRVLHDAEEAGYSVDSILDLIEEYIKDQYNAKIDAQIAELMAKKK